MNRIQPIIAASLASVAAVMSTSLARAELVVWTNGGGNSQWHNPANWSPPHVPTAADDVVNTTGGQIFVLNGALAKSIQSNGLVQLLGTGIVHLFGDANFDGGLVMFSNTDALIVQNDGTMTIGTSCQWHNGFIYQSTLGVVDFAPDCVTVVHDAGGHLLAGGQIFNEGVFVMLDGVRIDLGEGFESDPFTSFTNTATGSLELYANATFADQSGVFGGSYHDGGDSDLYNEGIMYVVGGTSQIETDIAFACVGTMVLTNATLDVQNFLGVAANGQLGLGTYLLNNAQLQTNSADILSLPSHVAVSLSGPASAMDGLFALQNNFGHLTVNNGAALTLAPYFFGSFTNHGVLEVGGFASLTINGNFVNASDGTLRRTMTVDGDVASIGRVESAVSSSLDGTLVVTMPNEYALDPGDELAIVGLVDGGCCFVSGQFASIATQPMQQGASTAMAYTAPLDKLVATVAMPCIGDVNNDGFVDGSDLGLLLAAWGASGPGAGGADLNGDGMVDGADLGLLLAAWGTC